MEEEALKMFDCVGYNFSFFEFETSARPAEIIHFPVASIKSFVSTGRAVPTKHVTRHILPELFETI